MATDWRRRLPVARLVAALAVGLAWMPAPASARVFVTAETEVRSLDFQGARSVPERRLRSVMHTRPRGRAFGLRVALARLPLVPPPERHIFHPRVLQEDVVRLRSVYHAEGFPDVRIRYEAAPVEDEDLLDITLLVEEGPPQRVTDAAIVPADGAGELPVPERDRGSWAGMERRTRDLVGHRVRVAEILEHRDLVQAWWLDRGFPDASVRDTVDPDSLAAGTRVRFLVDPGAAATFGPVEVTGNETLDDAVVVAQLPFRPGDVYSTTAIRNARRDLQRLEIVRTAHLEPRPDDAPPDGGSGIPVRVNVVEDHAHVIEGDLGYGTDAGILSGAVWSHRDFLGGARVLTISALGETGVLALEEDADVRYRGTVSLTQPHLMHRTLSGVVSPFVEYREDKQDRSREIGSNFTLVYQSDGLASASLDYRISSRRIYEYRAGELLSGELDLLTLLAQVAQGQLDSLGTDLTNSVFTLAATVGSLDDLVHPRRGLMFRPSIQVTAPTAWSSESYWRPEATGYAFLPVSRRVTLAGRVSAGRALPFGKSVPRGDEDPLSAYLRLRDATFTAGGGADVRGWGSDLLGPKFPDIRFVERGDSLAVEADGYVPLGGLQRLTFSAELRLPFPGLGPRFGSHVFLDGGRVWTSDDRFGLQGGVADDDGFFYGTGFGLDLRTPVGFVRGGVGYKLNPSIPDVVDSGDLLQAVADGTPLDSLPRHEGRRWHFYLSLGASY